MQHQLDEVERQREELRRQEEELRRQQESRRPAAPASPARPAAPATPAAPAGGGQTRDNVVSCRVDDRTLNVLEELVEAGVYATRSEAAARLIQAGIEANQALLEQVAATVADIRRLREQAQALTRGWREGGSEGSA